MELPARSKRGMSHSKSCCLRSLLQLNSWLRQQKEREELEIQWAEEANQKRIREEIQERKNNEIRKFNLMSKYNDRHDKAERIRRYIAAVEQRAIRNNIVTQELKEWVIWVVKKVY